MEWERKGECTFCGWCCEQVGFSTAEVSNPNGLIDPEFYRIRGFRLFHIEGKAVKATARIEQRSVCPQFKDQRCAIYEGRPQTCREFPSRPEQIIGIPCGYWFQRGDEIVRGTV